MSGREPFRLEKPWRTKAEVPPGIWKGHRWSYPGASGWSDEKYLEALNDSYYWYWVRDDAKKAAKKSSQSGKISFNGEDDLVLCAGHNCPKKVDKIGWRRGDRLCTTCQVAIKAKGQIGHIAYKDL